MSKFALEDLAAGSIIYANIIINQKDAAYFYHCKKVCYMQQSFRKVSLICTHNRTCSLFIIERIKSGKPVKRLCVVLEGGTKSVNVTYLATFASSTTFPTTLDTSMWYPITGPATQESSLSPLPASALANGRAQWACPRTTQVVTEDPVSTDHYKSQSSCYS